MRQFMGAGVDQVVVVPSDLDQPHTAKRLVQLQLVRREITVLARERDVTASAFSYVKAHENILGRDVIPALPQPRMRALEKFDNFFLHELPCLGGVQMRLFGRRAGCIPRWFAVPVGVGGEYPHGVIGVVGQAGDGVLVPLDGRG